MSESSVGKFRAPAAVPPGILASTFPPDPGSILLVESNPITRSMLRDALEMEGYGVVEAATGRMALETAAVRSPDLVIVNFVLPDMDALQVLSTIRLDAPDLPAIVVTGMVARHGERDAGSSSTHFVARPVQVPHLLDVVRAQLASAEQPAVGTRILVVGDVVKSK